MRRVHKPLGALVGQWAKLDMQFVRIAEPRFVVIIVVQIATNAGRRADHDKRPELNRGTVDFVVPEKYYATQPRPRLLPSYASSPDTPRQSMSELETRPPIPLRTLFVIDVSSGAISNGTVQSVCDCIRDALYGGSPNELNTINGPPYAFMQVGFLTFSDSLHFYDLSPNLLQPGMLVVADVDEVFVPTREGLFVDPLESRVVIESLLNSIPTIFAETPMPHAALCASLQGGLATLARTGGQMLVFASTFPNYGPGILQPRVDNEVYNTSKEKTLWEPQDIAWKELAEECAESGVGVNLWAFPDRLMDIGTIGKLPRWGHQLAQVEERYSSTLGTELTETSTFFCQKYAAHLPATSDTTALYECGAPTDYTYLLTPDSSIAGLLSHNNYGPAPGGGLDDRRDAYLQAAVLYTTVEGERRVRVCNIGFKPSTLAGNVFKRADQDTGVCLLAKEAALAMSRKMLSEIREDLTQRFVDLLVGYRRNCAASTAHTQLILPESYKLLPVLGNAILKTQALKGGPVSSDVRCVSRSRILSAGVQSLMTYLYPRITPIHAAPHNRSLLDVHRMPATYTKMVSDGAYLMDNGEVTILWLGGAVSPQILLDLFGVDDWDTLGPAVNALPPLDTPLSSQLRDLIRREEARRGGRTVPFLVARQNLDAAEIEFGNLLVEDENNDAMSYMDYLCHLHRQISDTLSKGQGWNLWS
ncbi:COPII coat Sec23p-Sfb3p heterodimer component [Tulasnella sp. 403]|nr:COPII coat Sec23p-Sfb3p heterodimer component [Tulasnella sp. 403]